MIRYSYARERSYPRRETTCAAWWSDCGFGIWNNNTCECDCISPYCFDELHQSCVTQGSCPNAFEGCLPYVNCPYYYNPAGRCDSSPNIHQGVFTIFWDAESCCTANFPTDVSKCSAASTSNIDTADQPTLLPTSMSPALVLDEIDGDIGSDDKGSIKVPTFGLVTTMTVLFVVACGGLMIWRRKQQNQLPSNQIAAVVDKTAGESLQQTSFIAASTSCKESQEASKESQEEIDDDGYDGGDSSYMNSIGDESDFSFPTNEYSNEGDSSVLGLLYYDGEDFSSSDEDGDKSKVVCRASRRRWRSSGSKKEIPTKASQNETKKSRQASRKRPMDKLDEEIEYGGKQDPEGFDGNTIMSGSQSQPQGSTFVYREESLSTTLTETSPDTLESMTPTSTIPTASDIQSLSVSIIPTKEAVQGIDPFVGIGKKQLKHLSALNSQATSQTFAINQKRSYGDY